ncbi:MAG: metal ABC transporter substrate-binding protein, partial [Clostridia bacterium]
GLDYYAAFPGCSSETEPNAATIAFLIDEGREEKIPVILKEKMSNDNIASAIAEETGSKVLSLYACHNIPAEDFENGETYVSLMNKNLVVLKEALNGWH